MRRYTIRHDRSPGSRFDRTYHLVWRRPALLCEARGHQPVERKPPGGLFRVECGRCGRLPQQPVVKTYGFDAGRAAVHAMFGSLDEYARYVTAGGTVAWGAQDAKAALRVFRGRPTAQAGAHRGSQGGQAHLMVPRVGGLILSLVGIGVQRDEEPPAQQPTDDRETPAEVSL